MRHPPTHAKYEGEVVNHLTETSFRGEQGVEMSNPLLTALDKKIRLYNAN
jgi:hypothetical protein